MSNTLLRSVAGRNALLTGIIADTVQRDEIVYYVLKDNEPRLHKRPVVVEDRRFESIIEAAQWLHGIIHPQKVSKSPIQHQREIGTIHKRISRWCNQDNVAGYYWAE